MITAYGNPLPGGPHVSAITTEALYHAGSHVVPRETGTHVCVTANTLARAAIIVCQQLAR